ncbi:putative inactive methylesterase 20 [Panicum virgatum]|uniref:putative inactive methylesterase 20 n=1 Tax=Panicum virgatum TaxID=38727 RepID=UPI0019D59D6D|nr:putative inactive methylesterase 20 [Panicum virgatum]
MAEPAATTVRSGCTGATHIFLVHGVCHGGWCWYKVAARLRRLRPLAAGRVVAPDLAASGVDDRRLREVLTFRDYSAPLLDALRSLPDRERAVVVGHSLGGLSVALAAEEFPDKVAAAVFLCAFMPDCTSPPGHVLLQVNIRFGLCVEIIFTVAEIKKQYIFSVKTVIFSV